MPSVSGSRKRAMASRKRGSAIQWADQVGVGRKPRLTLCSPWAPGSKRVESRARCNSPGPDSSRPRSAGCGSP